MSEVNVVADAKKFVNWLEQDADYPHTVVAMRKVFDYVERLEAQEVIAEKLIEELAIELGVSDVGASLAIGHLFASVEKYLHPQGDTTEEETNQEDEAGQGDPAWPRR